MARTGCATGACDEERARSAGGEAPSNPLHTALQYYSYSILEIKCIVFIDFDFSVFLNGMTCIMSSTGTFEFIFFLQLYVISWNFELLRNVAGILY